MLVQDVQKEMIFSGKLSTAKEPIEKEDEKIDLSGIEKMQNVHQKV